MYTFLVSSAIETNRGIFNPAERLEQTLETFKSIKKHIPDANIIVFDNGVTLSEKAQETLKKECLLIRMEENKKIIELSRYNMISHAEIVSTHWLLSAFSYLIPLDTKRIFKLSGRYRLQDSFDISAYDNIGDKFVFAKRRKTWLPEERQKELNLDSLFNTRFYSFTYNLIDYYRDCLRMAFDDLNLGLDFEHVIYKNIDKNLVVEFDKVHCEGRIAPDGSTEID